jgi:glycogen synthase
MNILIISYAYFPSIGGIETVTKLMAEGFSLRGHNVKTVTDTTVDASWTDSSNVYRRPSPFELIKLSAWADVIWQNGISLKYLWAAFLCKKPTAVTLQCPIYPSYPTKTLREQLKALSLRGCRVLAISRYVLNDTTLPFDLVGNPYNTSCAVRDSDQNVKRKDFVVVGRLVSDKGVDLFIQAVARLVCDKRQISCTIVGDGPERENLQKLAAAMGVERFIEFVGYRNGDALYHLIAEHNVIVVPSRWNEPFGVVALEGIACGCIVVGSNGGGLPLAIGPCGITFENNNVDQLIDCLQRVLDDNNLRARLRMNRSDHLSRFNLDALVQHYIAVFEALIEKRCPPRYEPLELFR